MDPIDPIKAFAAGWVFGETYNALGGKATTEIVKDVAKKLDVRNNELVALIKASGELVTDILGVQ